jgi:16S rRNA (guanine527-N7)-methyltransferase
VIGEQEVVAAVGALVAREGGAPAGWAGRLARYLSLLVEWNQKVNLVSRRSVDRIIEAQLRPSLAPLLLLPSQCDARVLDVGSGGGFPGIPLKVLRPDIRLDLVEAKRKKCRFLRACVDALELADTEVHWCRVEAPAPSLLARKPFDVVLARGVGDVVALSRVVCGLLSENGQGWTFSSPSDVGARDGAEVRLWKDERGSALTCLRALRCS